MNERCNCCKQLNVIIRGAKADGTDGLLYNAMRTHEEVFGTPGKPGGLTAKVEHLTTVLKYGVGFLSAINVGWIVFTHFHK